MGVRTLCSAKPDTPNPETRLSWEVHPAPVSSTRNRAAVEGVVNKAGLSGFYAFIPFILGLPNQDIGGNIELPVQAPDHPD